MPDHGIYILFSFFPSLSPLSLLTSLSLFLITCPITPSLLWPSLSPQPLSHHPLSPLSPLSSPTLLLSPSLSLVFSFLLNYLLSPPLLFPSLHISPLFFSSLLLSNLSTPCRDHSVLYGLPRSAVGIDSTAGQNQIAF